MDHLPLLLALLVFLVQKRITLCFDNNIKEKRLLLIVYVDDIIITGGDAWVIADLKCYLQKQFQAKDLRFFYVLLSHYSC